MGESRLDIFIPSTSANGVIRFPSNSKLAQKKINSVRVIPSTQNNGNNTLALNEAFGFNNSGIFLNLFDKDQNQFFYNAPCQFFNAAQYGVQFYFKPRYLSLSDCFVQFFGRPTGSNFGLILIVSFEE